MPQATDEQRARWNGPDSKTAIKFLKNAGYTFLESYSWKKPSPDHEPTERELDAIWFLIDEWDFGGIEDAS